MAWMMEPASLIFVTDVVLLFSKSVNFNATIYFCLSVCCVNDLCLLNSLHERSFAVVSMNMM